MSTRCNIIVKDSVDQLWFYRHCDGYPSSVIPSLRKFMLWLNRGQIRNNVSQAAGWLIVLGHEEYLQEKLCTRLPGEKGSLSGWKVGAYEPTTSQHCDISYLYTIDLVNPKFILCKNIDTGKVKKYKSVLQKYLRRRETFNCGDDVLVSLKCGVDEFMAIVVATRFDSVLKKQIITVEDQEGDCFVCEPSELKHDTCR